MIVESIELMLKDKYNFESTHITHIYAGLTKYTNQDKGVWDIIKKSSKIEINQQISKQKGIDLENKSFIINRSDKSDLNNY